MPDVIESVLELVSPVSVFCERVKKVCSAASTSVWQRAQL